MKHFFAYSFIALFILSLIGCSSLTENLKSTPTAIGSINQVVVICDEDIWNSPIGDTFRYQFESAYPLLPAPEPRFDLKYYSPFQLSGHQFRKELRTYLYLGDLQNTESATTKAILEDLGEDLIDRVKAKPELSSITGRDKWAYGQLIVYLFGLGNDNLIANIKNSYEPIERRIHNFDKSAIDAYAYLNGVNELMIGKMKSNLGFSIKVPADYIQAMEDENTLWLRKDEGVMISNIIFKKFPYENESQLTKEGLKKMVNQLGRDLVTSDTPGSYLQINDIDLPLLMFYPKLDNAYTIELRGIWELTYDYMGGPFLAYAIKHPSKEEIIIIHSFVYAPGEEKREPIQQLEHIISSLDFLS